MNTYKVISKSTYEPETWIKADLVEGGEIVTFYRDGEIVAIFNNPSAVVKCISD
jgi:hypothetical protein